MKKAFTLIELLTILAIVALLTGILIPVVGAVKNFAYETKQRAQFSTIKLGLIAFKNDYGDYPPSYYGSPLAPPGIYCGAQKLAEALLGQDLLGFHPKSAWRWDGFDSTGKNNLYDSAGDLSSRKGPYLNPATKRATLTDLFPSHSLAAIPGADRYVICDVFGATKIMLPDGKTTKVGAPILYYKANSSGITIYEIYDSDDNLTIVGMKETVDRASVPAFSDSVTFYDYIKDPQITARPWPYRPTSYILISAGSDGLYGTGDDIRNFRY